MTKKFVFKVYGDKALFTDPASRSCGKFSYPIPTYEALKGIVKSVYWKPSIIWHVDRVKVVNRIEYFSMTTSGILYRPEKDSDVQHRLEKQSYLRDVEYVVECSYEHNPYRSPDMVKDGKNRKKHDDIMRRSITRGGRMPIFLGTSECMGFVEPVDSFDDVESIYDSNSIETEYFMFHGFDYPDESGENYLYRRDDKIVMKNGVIEFNKPSDCISKTRLFEMEPKTFGEIEQ